MRTEFDSVTLDRFWAKVRKTSDCWLWEAAGVCRPIFWLDGRNEMAYRVSFCIAHGSLPADKVICHKCDNPFCVNPDHLFAGTYKDNTQDARTKGRLVGTPTAAKLNAAQVAAIKDAYGTPLPFGRGRKHGQLTMKQLGAKYGITAAQVCELVNGRSYKNVAGR